MIKMPRSATPSRSRAGMATRSPARSRSRSRGRPAGGGARSPGRVGRPPARVSKSPVRVSRSPARVSRSPARVSRSPARDSGSPARVRRSPGRGTETASAATARSPIRLSRSRSPARLAAASAHVKPAPPRPATPPPQSAGTAGTLHLTSTPKTEVRARRAIAATLVDGDAAAAAAAATAAAGAAAVTAAVADFPATRQSARIASKLKELGIDPGAGGDMVGPTTADSAAKPATNSASWGRVLATPLVLLIALLPFYLFSACNKKQCSIGRLPEMPRRLQAWLDPAALLGVAAMLTLQLLLALLPLGSLAEGQISKHGLQRHRCNGFLSLVLTLGAALAAFYLDWPVLAAVGKLRQLLVASAAWAVLLSAALHVRSRRAHLLDISPAGDTDSLLVNLVSGRELSPRLLGVDLKLVLVRAACVSSALLALLLLLAERAGRGSSSPTMLAAAAAVLADAADRMWFEDTLLTTFTFADEPLGLRLVLSLMMLPFVSAFNLRFIIVTRVDQPWYALLGCGLLFMVGYLIQRSSNSQKNEFRNNPVNPALAHLETIPTTKGKKLLVSGWWGVVRHPNHLGGLLMVAAASLLLGFHHALAWVTLPCAVFATVLHVRRVDAHCRHKYGAAWQRYVDRVRFSLVPSVF